MANMSYCRFRNTLTDLRDCLDNMDDPNLSEEETRARELLIEVYSQIAADYGEQDDEEE